MDRLKLVIPHWYGANNKQILEGCRALQNCVDSSGYSIIQEIKNGASTGGGIMGGKIKAYEQVIEGLQAIRNKLKTEKPKEVFTLGGDCGIAFPLISYMASLYGSDMGLVWIDAHGDVNTPETSPSGNFHGMPVRCLMGDGDKRVLSAGFATLDPQALIYTGIRDLDLPEKQWIKANNVSVLNQRTDILNALQKKGFKKIYVHLDLDVIDPREFSAVTCPTPEGLSVQHVVSILEMLSENFHVVGATLTECAARDKSDLKPITPIIDWWEKVTLN